ARSCAPAYAGPLRRASSAYGDDARPARVSRREGTRPLRGARGPLDAAARSPADRGLRPPARTAGPFGRLAVRPRRLAAALRPPGLVPTRARRRDRDRTARRVARRARRHVRGAPRRNAARPAPARRRPAPRP